MLYKLSKTSYDNMSGIHPDLVKVVEAAITITHVDFAITEGLRTVDRESAMVAEGKPQTMHSRHLTGHAVDVAAIVDGTVSWEEKYYSQIANAMLGASASLKIPLIWGGSWRTLKDLCHFELNRKFYP